MKGLYVALVTAFEGQNQINPKAMHQLMDKNISEGASGFFVGGSAGECFLLSKDERIKLFEIAKSHGTQLPLVAHVGAISTGEAVEYAKAAANMGYKYISATPPFYYGFSMREIASYFYKIAESSGLPVLLYNFPGNTGKSLDIEDSCIIDLLRSKAVFGIKHTNLNQFQMERIRHINKELVIMNGFDETMLPGLALGIDGSIGSSFNVLLPLFTKLCKAFYDGRMEEAREYQQRANNIMQTMYSLGLIPSVKYIVGSQGIDVGPAREPFSLLSEEDKTSLDRVIKKNLY